MSTSAGKLLFSLLTVFISSLLTAGIPAGVVEKAAYPFTSPRPVGKYSVSKTRTLLMDGKTAKITFPADKLQNPEKGLSVLAVFRYRDLPGRTEADKAYNALVYRHMQFSFGFNRKRIDVQFFDGRKSVSRICKGINYDDGQWHTAAFTVDRWKEPTQGMDHLRVKVYFDGRLIADERFHNVSVADAKHPLNIGHARGFGDVWHWNGEIAGVYAYNRVLKPDEIENFTASSPWMKITSGLEKLDKKDQLLLKSLPEKDIETAAAASALRNLALRGSRCNWRQAAQQLKKSGKSPALLRQYKLEGALLTVAADKTQALPVSLYDTQNRREMLHPENPFYRVHFRNNIYSPFSGEKSSEFRALSADRFRITSRYPGFTAEAEYSTRNGKLTAYFRVPGKVTLDKVDFPMLKINPLDKGAVLFTPEMSGIAHPDAAARSIGYEADYPRGVASMQYGLFYDKRSGIFWSTADPEGRSKKLNFSAGRNGVNAVYTWLPPRNEGFNACPMGSRIELFKGDWYDGAMIYRQLLQEIKAVWFSTASLPRQDTPSWARECLFSTRLSFKYSPPEALRRMAEYMDIPFAVQLGMWFAGFYDRDYPNFRALPSFTEYAEKLRGMGLRIIPYTNGRLWELLDRRNEDWRYSKEGKANCITDKNGQIVINNFAVDFAIICPATKLYEQSVSRFIRNLFAWGADGIYVDQIGAAWHMPCYNSAHGHKIPDDTMFFQKGHNRVFPAMRRMMRRISSDSVLTTEDNSEVCVKNFDMLLAWRWTCENQVPAFPAVYSGRTQLYGMQDREITPGMFDASAWQFISGAQLSAGQVLSFVQPELKEFRLWLKQLTRLRHAMLDFFNAGLMRRPAAFAEPLEMKRSFWGNTGSKYVTAPQIRTSSWQLNGARAAVFLNPSDKVQKNIFSFEKDFPAGRIHHFSSTGKERVFSYTPGGKISLELAPRSFQLFLHLPANDDGAVLLEKARADFDAIQAFASEPDPFLTTERKTLGIADQDAEIIRIDTGIFDCRFFPGALYPDNFRKGDGPKRLNPLWKLADPFGADEIVIGKERFESRQERWADQKILLNTKERCIVESRGTFCTFSKTDTVLPHGAQITYTWEFLKNSPVIKAKAELRYPEKWQNARASLLKLVPGCRFTEKSRKVRHLPGKLTVEAVFTYSANSSAGPFRNQIELTEKQQALQTDRAVHAQREMKKLSLPRTIDLDNGQVFLRLDSHKFWNINKVDILSNGRKRNFGIENKESHYGAVLRLAGSPFFIGSGHCESGKSEIVKSLKIIADGKEITPGKAPIRGKCIRVEKISQLAALQIKYTFCLQNKELLETVELFSPEEIKSRCTYFFMHPWNPRFSSVQMRDTAGKEHSRTTARNNSHPFGMNVFFPAAAWHDARTKDTITTYITRQPESGKMRRYIWDRKVYCKDYLVDFLNDTIPRNTKVIYRAKTVFSNGEAVLPSKF